MPEVVTAKAGFVAITGLPNVGKSSLLNFLAGGKLSIISTKPQTTRQNITAIVEDGAAQGVFVDTPGFLNPEYGLQRTMVRNVRQACDDDSDIILFVTEPRPPLPEELKLAELVARCDRPVYLAVNKTDTASNKSAAESAVEGLKPHLKIAGTFFVSAKTGAGLKNLRRTLLDALPPHPHYFPDGQWTDRWERFYAAEFIREQIFHLFSEEIPYSCAVEIEEFHERRNGPDHIRAVIHVERDTQKGIIVGKGGKMIKQLRENSTPEIEKFLGRPVRLELFVKHTPDWRNRKDTLELFEYL
ncbi:MAG: GTPase Era [Elusimicrobiaceae bacterium]|nr:GTPase Era [Elusimicrobiaceae bacterium]